MLFAGCGLTLMVFNGINISSGYGNLMAPIDHRWRLSAFETAERVKPEAALHYNYLKSVGNYPACPSYPS